MRYYFNLILLVVLLCPSAAFSQYSTLETPSIIDSDNIEDFTGKPVGTSRNPGGRPEGYNCWDYGNDNKSLPAKGFSQIPIQEIPDEFDAIIDLRDKRFGSKHNEAITLLETSEDGKALIKLVLNPATTEFTKARIEIEFGEKTEGHMLNIGDSVSNNGFGGDGATQSRDSEAQIVNGDLTVFGDDFAPVGEKKTLAAVKEFVRPNSKVILELSNNSLSWQNNDGQTGTVNSPFLFSLDGQEDKEGKVNFDIFLGLNRVVDGDYRAGKGLEKVKIKLLH